MKGWLHFLVPLLLLTASCEHKELCYDHPHTVHLNVEFDWTRAPDAEPKTMSVYFFQENGTASLRYEFIDINGSEIRINPGKYRAICHNSDTWEIIHYDRSCFDTFMLTTEGGTAAPLWTDSISYVDISEDDQTITFVPEKVHCNYTIEVRNVENIKYLSYVTGSLTSLSSGWLPGIEELCVEHIAYPFEIARSLSEKRMDGYLVTFGHCTEDHLQHKLIIYATISDGNRYSYTYDVTDQIHNAPDKHNIHIIVDGLSLPKPVTDQGGMMPTVNDWNQQDIEIPM